MFSLELGIKLPKAKSYTRQDNQRVNGPLHMNQLTDITVWSRPLLLAQTPDADTILISIFDPSDGPLPSYDGWKAALQLCFHDTDGSSMGLQAPNIVHGLAVKEFLEAHPDAKRIKVHCAAGQSRSAGVALALSEMLEVPAFLKGQTLLDYRYPFYNRKAYKAVMGALNGQTTDDPA